MTPEELINEYYLHPLRFVEEVIGVVPTPQQRSILEALPNDKRINVRSGNGVGKTACESWIILWFMTTHPYCRVICTAPTGHQLYDVLWPEVKKWLDKCILKDYFTWSATSIFNKEYPDTWFGVAGASSEAVNFQGFHEENILFIVDEASGVEDDIWEAIRGSLTTKNSYALLFGNPNFLEGFFYHSFHKNASLWTNFKFCGLESPLVKQSFVDEIISDFGIDSNVYRVRVLGEFPTEESSDLYFPLSLVQGCLTDKANVWLDEPHPDFEYDLGADIARFGDDETVFTISKYNMRYVPKKWVEICNVSSVMHKPLTEIAGRIINLHLKWHFKTIYVDETGIGGGVYDMLKEQGLPVFPVTFNKKLDQVIADTNKEAMYKNLKLLMEKQKAGPETVLLVPNLPKLVTQLTSMHFEYSSSGTLMIHHEDGGHDDYSDSLALSLFRLVLKKKKVSYAIA